MGCFLTLRRKRKDKHWNVCVRHANCCNKSCVILWYFWHIAIALSMITYWKWISILLMLIINLFKKEFLICFIIDILSKIYNMHKWFENKSLEIVHFNIRIKYLTYLWNHVFTIFQETRIRWWMSGTSLDQGKSDNKYLLSIALT